MDEWWHSRVAAFGAPLDPRSTVSSNTTKPVKLPTELIPNINSFLSESETQVSRFMEDPHAVTEEAFIGMSEQIIEVRPCSRAASSSGGRHPSACHI